MFVFVYLRLLVGCLLPIGYVVGYDLFWCDCLFVVLLLRLLVVLMLLFVFGCVIRLGVWCV